MSHPEEPGNADTGSADTTSKDEDEAIKRQLMASLGSNEVPKLEVSKHNMCWHEPYVPSLCSLTT